MEDGSAWKSLGSKDLLNTGIILSICIKIESSYIVPPLEMDFIRVGCTNRGHTLQFEVKS